MVTARNSGLEPSVAFGLRNLTGLQQVPLHLPVSFAAKPETVEKVCGIVKKQMRLPDGSAVTGESTFQGLKANSFDTGEIVLALEEAFGITVTEESAQNITTLQDAADLIEKLIKKN